MYETYWKLKEKPFSNTPDPKFLYYSREHEEALARLTYAITENMGACMLTGIFGCGKTLICQKLIDNLRNTGRYKIALINNPQLSNIELLRSIAYHLGATDLPKQRSELLGDYLLEVLEEMLNNNSSDGKDTVIVIDEAHIIEDKIIFEELRLLLNFQRQDRFLLTLVLVGQPELKKNVDNIKQLTQRIAIRCHLDRLTEEETRNYIKHRLKYAGAITDIFSDSSIGLIHERSGGIPRRINHICDLSLLSGFGQKVNAINDGIINDVVKDLES